MLFGDHEWHLVDVLAWWVDDRGRQVVEVDWHAEMSTWREAYLFDPAKARED